MKYNNVNDFKEDIISLYKQGMLKKDIRMQLNLPEAGLTKFFKENEVYRFNENIFESVDNEEKAYWLGFLWADGYCKSGIDIELTDEDHVIKLKEFLAISSPIKTRNRNNSITYRLNANSNKFANDLNNLGFGLKDNRTELPIISENLIKDFVRGYFDGDGHIRNDNTFEGIDISGRVEFIDNLKIVLKDYITREELHSTHSKRIYTNKLKGIQFLDYIYKNATVYLTRKYTIALSVRNN